MSDMFETFYRSADPIARALAILDEAIEKHKLTKIYGLFSGGHDSVISTLMASQLRQFQGAAHIPTTIGIEETHDYVVETSHLLGWPLSEWRGPRTYESLVLEYGFPGPGGHLYMYSWLKERAVRKLVRASKSDRHERIGLVTGVRKSESTRRMGHVVPIYRSGCQVWISPLIDFTDDDKEEYLTTHQLPRNPVVDKICKSGECLCGAFAKLNELIELEAAYPAKAAEIRALMAKAKALGVHDRWGERPPPKIKQMACSQCAQSSLFDTIPEIAA